MPTYQVFSPLLSVYDEYNYRDMVLRCNHYSAEQQHAFHSFFSKYKGLFRGKLGSVPGPPVSLKLKPGSKPFCSRAYTVSKSIEQVAKKEINDLVDVGVFVKNLPSEWASPSFFFDLRRMGESVLYLICVVSTLALNDILIYYH